MEPTYYYSEENQYVNGERSRKDLKTEDRKTDKDEQHNQGVKMAQKVLSSDAHVASFFVKQLSK